MAALQNWLEKIKTLIPILVELTHLDLTRRLCLHTDASDNFHVEMPTKCPPEDLEKSESEWRHAPLAFVSGSFRGAMLRWSVFGNDAFVSSTPFHAWNT